MLGESEDKSQKSAFCIVVGDGLVSLLPEIIGKHYFNIMIKLIFPLVCILFLKKGEMAGNIHVLFLALGTKIPQL